MHTKWLMNSISDQIQCSLYQDPLKRQLIQRQELQKNWVEKLNYIVKHSSKDDVQIIAGVPSWVLITMNEVIRENKINNIHEIWPSLELYLHGGMNIAPYKKNFQSISSKKINFYQNYNATEGFFGLQSENDAEDMQRMIRNLKSWYRQRI